MLPQTNYHSSIQKILSFFVVFLLLTIGSAASTSVKTNKEEKNISSVINGESLVFGLKQNLTSLNVHGVFPSDFIHHKNQKIIPFNFDYTTCNIYSVDGEYVYIDIKGLQPHGTPGEPLLPMKTFVINLPKQIELLDVGISHGHYVEIKNKLRIIPTPQPMFWSDLNFTPREFYNRFIPNMTIYNSDQLFPGTVISYTTGCDNEKTKVFVRVYPLQYIPKNGDIFLLTDGIIKIYYREKETPPLPQTAVSSNFSNLIITPPFLYTQAMQLKKFHDAEGTITAVVNTTWIYENYEEADDPPFPGYGNPNPFDEPGLHDYNYSLAKKIISYLNDTVVHPELQYVTLLGNARVVPPSYYYQFYYTWVPTDFFYSSPEYDLIPNYKIGRLPVNNVTEAIHVVNKIMHWNASSELFGNITVAGGKPFGTPYDIGEMIIIDAINQGLFRGVKPTKCFRTEHSFDRFNLSKAMSEKTGVLYHIGHGNGSAWHLEGDPLNVNDLLNLPPSDSAPIVVSIACENGAFDTHVGNADFNISFGEAVLLSPAGGIAYIGGSRSNAGAPLFTLDEGRLTIYGETYMAAMLTALFEPYETCTLGDLTEYAMRKYVEHHDFTDPLDSYTFFCFTLLGDPALSLPERPTGATYQTPCINIENWSTLISVEDLELSVYTFGISMGGTVSLNPIKQNIPFTFSTVSPTIELKIVDGFAFEDMIMEKTSLSNPDHGEISYGFISYKGSLYSIRVILEDGKEGWLFAASARIVDDDYNKTTPGFNESRWREIQAAIENVFYPSEIIYVFNGTYHEHLLINKSVKIIGENVEETIIDGDGEGTVVRIVGDLCSLSGFSVVNGGNKTGDSGISIEGSMTFISRNVVRDNGRNGVSITGSTFMPFLFSNEISNNHYGLYLQNTGFFVVIACNVFKDNECGVYLLDSDSQTIFYNEILSAETCIYLKNSDGNTIFANNISNGMLGIYLENSEENIIGVNNFFNNERHAKFYLCKKNRWMQNYWNRPRILPKIILGRAGKQGLIPWINIDITPAREPITVPSLSFFGNIISVQVFLSLFQ